MAQYELTPLVRSVAPHSPISWTQTAAAPQIAQALMDAHQAETHIARMAQEAIDEARRETAQEAAQLARIQ